MNQTVQLETMVRFLEWRRSQFWRAMDDLRSQDPWKSERARPKVEEARASLDRAFQETHRAVSIHRIFLAALVASSLFVGSTIAEAGIIGGTFDVAGDVIALPFQMMGELFRVVF